jgi:hypothetical protein
MILASHGLIASSIAQFDADALAFFARVTAAGGSLSLTEKNATNQLVLDLKANSLWTPMKAIYPMVGASAAACAQNLKSSSFTGTFTSGWTFASTGVTGNGFSSFFNTNFNASTQLSNNNIHISGYSRSQKYPNSTATPMIVMAALGTGSNLLDLEIINASSANKTASYIYDYDAGKGILEVATTNTLGFYTSTRTSTSSHKIYKNGLTIATSTTASNYNNSPNLNLYLGGLNNSGALLFSNDVNYAFASIGDGLTDTQASDFYTAVQAFQTTLSRNV